MDACTREPKPRSLAAVGYCRHGTTRLGVGWPSLSTVGPHGWSPARYWSGKPTAFAARLVLQIPGDRLERLRQVAKLSHCHVPDVLVAVFGSILDQHPSHRNAEIAILPALRGSLRESQNRYLGRDADAFSVVEMPVDMQMAITRDASAMAGPPKRGVAFRYGFLGGPALETTVARPKGWVAVLDDCLAAYDLTLDVREFDHVLRIVCFVKTRAMPLPVVDWLLVSYSDALSKVA